MILGTILSGLGYVALAFSPSIYLMLVAYAVLIGVGIAMYGPFPSSVLASNWFQPSPGPAIGFVNTPLFVALLPMAGLSLITHRGLPAFFLALAALHVLLLPFVWGVRDAPAAMEAAGADAHHAPPVPARAILSRPLFWTMTIGAGALNAAGITGVSHIVAFALERGISATQAALLISVMGGASIIGSLVVGMICAAIGAARTLALTGAGLALSWLVLLSTDSLPLMVPATLVIGACGAGVFPSVNVLSGQVFGTAALARVIGLFGLFTLPLTFCLPPAAGVLHDAARSYDPVVMVLVAICGAVMLLFYTTARIIARRERLEMAGAALG
jgi:cyanate permease